MARYNPNQDEEFDTAGFEDGAEDACPYCGADLHDGCNCHEDVLGFPENCPSD